MKERDIKEYELRKYTRHPAILDKLLSQRNFFLDMEPIKDSCKYLTKLIEDGHDVVIVTQLPRRSNHWAARDKKQWLETHIPALDLCQLIFAHRKDLVMGDVLFDDSPHHLQSWLVKNPDSYICTIDYPYNQDIKTDARFAKETAWKNFYSFVNKLKSR